MCVEAFTDYPPLVRFAGMLSYMLSFWSKLIMISVRDMRQTVAVGVIKSVAKSEKTGVSPSLKASGVYDNLFAGQSHQGRSKGRCQEIGT